MIWKACDRLNLPSCIELHIFPFRITNMRKIPPSYRNFLCLLLPGVYLTIVLLFDRMEPFRTVAPPLLTIGLLLFSLLIGPSWMVFWAIIYSSTATAILLSPRIYSFFSNGLSSPEMSSHKFRVMGFVSTAIFACVFSWVLNRLRSKQETLDHLLLQMPMPVVVSDIEGIIVLANDRARILLGLNGTERAKGLFFDLHAPRLHQGACIAEYLNIFKTRCSKDKTLKLEIAGKPAMVRLEFLHTTPLKLVTMIENVD